jgi:DNA-binding response OmpR family regulator
VEDVLPRGTETILVVEDEATVRKLLCSILTQLGYAVFDSAEASAALEWCDQHSAGPDLLVTDLVLPFMNGPDLAARIVGAHPKTRVLFVSGYAKDAFAQRGITLPANAVLTKPFTPSLLANRVRAVLNGPVQRFG